MAKKTKDGKEIIPLEHIETRIVFIRGQKVILDADLAALYGVPTKRFNEAFKRNRQRFPDDFAFQLTAAEFANLRSQFATSSLQANDFKEDNLNWPQLATSSHGGPSLLSVGIYRTWSHHGRFGAEFAACCRGQRICGTWL